MKVEQIQIRSHEREELIDITHTVQEYISRVGVENGSLTLFVPHTTAAITINENADPDVARDILYKLKKEFPQSDGYHHREGNADAHIKSSIIGTSLQVIVASGRLLLGTWQGIYFCEFDGPRTRKLHIKATID